MILQIVVSIIVIVASATLWRLGGNGYKWCRVMVGGVIGLGKTILFWNPICMIYWFWLWLMTAAFSYGDNAPPRLFWAWVLKRDKQDIVVQIATRATCSFFWALPAVTFYILGGSLLRFAGYVIALTILNVVIGLLPDVEISERGVGASVALAIFV